MNNLYDFELPGYLIAQEPVSPRDSARLLVYKLKTGEIIDAKFFELDNFLPESTTIVLNNSKVEKCRWLFEDAKTEVFVLEKSDPHTIRAKVRPGKKFRPGKSFKPNDWLEIITTNIDDSGIRTLKINVTHDDERLKEFEHIPLPPYIKQNDSLSEEYQTVYAKPPGSLAAPTAGLHFTDKLINELAKKHTFAELTLHVGPGTFASLTDENLKTGKLHEEQFEISSETALGLNDAKLILAVGTTTTRSLESALVDSKNFIKLKRDTDIFIRPGYKFKTVDSMITNFHLPSTSLLMLVSAFIADKRNLSEQASIEELMRIYRHAIDQNYRFYSFGDAMLLI